MSDIEWRNIDGFPGYWISEEGNVMSKRKIIKRHIHCSNAKEYLRVTMYDVSLHRKNKMVHRLVALAFIANPYHLPEVNHKDNNGLNPNKDNLEWATKSYNNKYKMLSREYAREEAEKQRMLEDG